MRLVTGCNAGYLQRMQSSLYSLDQHADFPVSRIAVGFSNHDWTTLTAEQNAGAPEGTECIQHGSFLKVVKGKADEVLLYADGDVVMQRPLDDDERGLLALKHGQALVGWNGGPHETLAVEAGRLGVANSVQWAMQEWGLTDPVPPIYNVGMLAMTRKTWRQVYNLYMQRWEQACQTFTHMARQQWLISYCIDALGLDVTIMPWHLHAHGHFGLKPGMERRGIDIYHDGRLAAFRHHT